MWAASQDALLLKLSRDFVLGHILPLLEYVSPCSKERPDRIEAVAEWTLIMANLSFSAEVRRVGDCCLDYS